MAISLLPNPLFFLYASLSRDTITGVPHHMGRCLNLNISDVCAQNWAHRVISATCPFVSYLNSGTSCIPSLSAPVSSSHMPDFGQ